MSRRNFSLTPEGRFYRLRSRKELPLMVWWGCGGERIAKGMQCLHCLPFGSHFTTSPRVLFYQYPAVNIMFSLILWWVRSIPPTMFYFLLYNQSTHGRCFVSYLFFYCCQILIISLSANFSRTPSKSKNYQRLGVNYCSFNLLSG